MLSKRTRFTSSIVVEAFVLRIQTLVQGRENSPNLPQLWREEILQDLANIFDDAPETHHSRPRLYTRPEI